MRFVGYSDADWVRDIDTRYSIIRYVVMLNKSTITWRCQRQATVTLSIMEVEYMALTETTNKLKWIRIFLAELGYNENNTGTYPG